MATPLTLRFADRRLEAAARAICIAVRSQGGAAHLVGGAVRDAALGRTVNEVDLECFGLAVEELHTIVSGIIPVTLVGASFGVLKARGLALDVSVPRLERKTGPGHRGFHIDADPHLDPAVAAARRDFTINAIAYDLLEDRIIDPFDGLDDLRRRVLRHTSPQFDEDPLRVLRGMQFIARFGLTADPDTVVRCRGIDPEGLAAERIFDEWRKLLLRGVHIGDGLGFLRDTGWIRHTPELEALLDCPQDPEWHPEGDVFVHTGHVLDQFASRRLGDDEEDLVVGLACLCHDLGKPATTVFDAGRWRSPGHEQAGIPPTRSLLGRMTSQHDLVEQVVVLVAEHLKPDQLHRQGAGAAAVRRLAARVGRLDRLLRVARADRDGRPPLPTDDFPAASWLLGLAAELDVLDAPPRPVVLGRHLVAAGLTPGPTFRPLLDACYEAQLDGRIATVEDGLELVRSLLPGTT
ncbi:MAG: HD domain-containing protein [Actinobacteria bacterium]|nr:HD domain-containing protein [Actinomycetota bacterium]